jgi:hypothetical protein
MRWDMKITATGKKNGKTVKLVYEDGEFTFNGEHNILYEMEIESHKQAGHPVGGTYYPQKDSPLNLINVIESYFFDRNAVVQVQGADIEEIPYEEGVVY